MTTGSLTVVGTGIRLITQLTPEARVAIEEADRVFYISTGPVATRWMEQLNPRAENLHALYQPGKERLRTYEEMIARVLAPLRAGAAVCFALYGHPGVLVYPAHEAIRRALREGHQARMLPGVSSEDCLFADLGVDPGASGCQSFDATDFLVFRRRFDPRSALVLYQIAVIGLAAHTLDLPGVPGLRLLAAMLSEHYPADHPAVVYAAAEHPGFRAGVERITLAALPEARPPVAASLYVPPLPSGEPDAATLEALGMR